MTLRNASFALTAAIMLPLAAEAGDPTADYGRIVRQQSLPGLRAVPRASNPSSGAYGIPQALPGSKMNGGGMRAPAMRGIGRRR
jgi:hypothetical protein